MLFSLKDTHSREKKENQEIHKAKTYLENKAQGIQD